MKKDMTPTHLYNALREEHIALLREFSQLCQMMLDLNQSANIEEFERRMSDLTRELNTHVAVKKMRLMHMLQVPEKVQ